MKQRLLFILLGSTALASAHFVFVVPQPGAATAQVILSETLKPSEEVDVSLISKATLSLRRTGGTDTPLTLMKADHAYVIELPGAGTRLIHGVVDLGVQQREQGKNHLLVYYPKTIVDDAFDPTMVLAGAAPVEIVPVGKPGTLRLKLVAHGQPQSGAEVTVLLPDGEEKKLKTDDSGLTEILTQTGRYGAWARYWEQVGGERDGKRYAETRNYATLVFDVRTGSATGSDSGSTRMATRFATLPQAASSFGAVVSDGWLYVYGGHIAPTHLYSTEAVSGHFARLKLTGATQWEQLPNGPPLQGMNLAAYKGKIYRIGGMAPKNKPGEAADNYSIADCARFDPATMKWEPLPPLPEPRSSHDVAVIGDKLIAVGGWMLKGAASPEWPDTLEILDLAAGKLQWQAARQPFKRRALIAAADSGRLFVMGGFDENSKIVHEVAIYNPGTDAWTKGPDLPGGEINGFAPGACVHAGNLYVSVADGTLYRLNEAKQEWEKSGNATPRIAHRIVSDDKTILVIGGAAKGQNSDLIEAASVASDVPR